MPRYLASFSLDFPCNQSDAHTILAEPTKRNTGSGRRRLFARREHCDHAVLVRAVRTGQPTLPEGAEEASDRQPSAELQHAILLQTHQRVRGTASLAPTEAIP